ncbi:malectin (di-glucose binding ER protein) [Motilibacter rhizosphaerae]|uniref:Malectin (Di-glucose binding ER protein) n=1 Tax=Motilibacter rhizosphaerae TaxID=598652 RepID=A0A4V2F551_9ACTN|nr:family 16 glycosylhydrolase [Motilibacter rhizosphaerae]RZS91599.1 malectin (di-glucose binding ER protein) [Motilibacter rhizosphaerae]
MTAAPRLEPGLAPPHGSRPPRRGRALVGLVVILALVAGALVGVRLLHRGAPGAAGFTLRQTVGTEEVTDSRGSVWSPATDVHGGTVEQLGSAPAGTASPQLYEHYRQGVTDWTIPVPTPGRYAVDLLAPRIPGDSSGARVFDVLSGGDPLARDVDLATGPSASGVRHVTGEVQVRGKVLHLTFPTSRGLAVASAVQVSWTGGLGKPRTLLHDDFAGRAGAAPGDPWTRVQDPGPAGEGELEAYTADSSTSSLDGQGHLVLSALHQPTTTEGRATDYASAKLTTEGAFAFTYGHVEARMQVPSGRGLWPAFWAIGTDRPQVDWPRSGEIDVMEVLGRDPRTVHANVHGLGDQQDPTGWRGQRVSGTGTDHDTGTDLTTGFHTYAADVRPGAITFSIDGRPYFTAAEVDLRSGQEWPFDKPFYLIVNLAVGGTWGGAPDSSTPFPAKMVIDSIRVTS